MEDNLADLPEPEVASPKNTLLSAPATPRAPRPHILSYLPQSLSAIGTTIGIIIAVFSLHTSNQNFKIANQAQLEVAFSDIKITPENSLDFMIQFTNNGNTLAKSVNVYLATIPYALPKEVEVSMTANLETVGPKAHRELERVYSPVPLGTPFFLGVITIYKNVFNEDQTQVVCQTVYGNGDHDRNICPTEKVGTLMWRAITANPNAYVGQQ
jgi:hypothetical protein